MVSVLSKSVLLCSSHALTNLSTHLLQIHIIVAKPITLRHVEKYFTLHTSAYEDGLTEGSETSAYINQTPGNYPKGNLLYSVHGESLKSRILQVEAITLYRVVQSRLTRFATHFCRTRGVEDSVCKPRRKWCHAVSKPVQWQWSGGVCGVLTWEEKHFHVSGIPLPVRSPDLTVPDFFLWANLKECLYRSRSLSLSHTHTHTHTHTQYRNWSLRSRMNPQP